MEQTKTYAAGVFFCCCSADYRTVEPLLLAGWQTPVSLDGLAVDPPGIGAVASVWIFAIALGLGFGIFILITQREAEKHISLFSIFFNTNHVKEGSKHLLCLPVSGPKKNAIISVLRRGENRWTMTTMDSATSLAVQLASYESIVLDVKVEVRERIGAPATEKNTSYSTVYLLLCRMETVSSLSAG